MINMDIWNNKNVYNKLKKSFLFVWDLVNQLIQVFHITI